MLLPRLHLQQGCAVGWQHGPQQMEAENRRWAEGRIPAGILSCSHLSLYQHVQEQAAPIVLHPLLSTAACQEQVILFYL